MRKTIISIENCIRFFEETFRDSFLTFQLPIEKRYISPEPYSLRVSGDSHVILEQEFLIGKHSITFIQSHEDPIVQDDTHIFLSIHLGSSLLKHKPGEIVIEITQGNFLYQEKFTQLSYSSLFDTLYSKIIGNTVTTSKDCNLSIHLGDSQSNYHEEYFPLKNGEIFDFSHYLPLYSYIGVQCSYENIFPEIEEKFILKGQKGIYETASFTADKKYVSQLPFSDTYLHHYNSQNTPDSMFTLVNTIDDILSFHQNHPIQYFESDYHFLSEHYKKSLTYSQSNLYSSKPLKGVIHTDLELCSKCPYRAICLQVVPSGLSYDLFKENMSKESFNECRLFKLIQTHI
jgi:hypothetical protein